VGKSYGDEALPYDEATAMWLLQYSAAAYGTNTSTCLAKFSNSSVIGAFSSPMQYDQTSFVFIAIDHSQQSIIVSFRGTDSDAQLVQEIISGVQTFLLPVFNQTQVLGYFQQAISMLLTSLNPTLFKLNQQFPNYPVYFTGHSLGGSLAAISAATAVGLNLVNPNVIQVYTFGEPRTGDYGFALMVNSLIPTYYRVINYQDIITHNPPCIRNLLFHCSHSYYFYSPYHQAEEIWYNPNGDINGTYGPYQICNGYPLGEDAACSDRAPGFSVLDHLHYFGIDVGNYCSM